MRHRHHFSKVMLSVLAFSAVNYIIFGLLPYLAFGSTTNSIITINMLDFATSQDSAVWHGFYIAVSIMLILSIATSYPIQLFVVTDIVERLMFVRWPKLLSRHKMLTQNVNRTVTVALTCVVAIAVPDFGILMGFLGSVVSSPLQFMLPPALALELLWHKLPRHRRALYVLYIAFGGLAAVLGFVQTIAQVID
jgi:solute carrier family 36 (proton-coupled amino acid transporter)